jgi:hypothetical protein
LDKEIEIGESFAWYEVNVLGQTDQPESGIRRTARAPTSIVGRRTVITVR